MASRKTTSASSSGSGNPYRAVRNLSLNERRWSRVRTLWLDQQSRSECPTGEVDDEEAVEERVRLGVAALLHRRREVFVLARYHDLSHQQIAVALGISVQTVTNHMSAALRDLRLALDDLLGDLPLPTPRNRDRGAG